MNRFLIIFLSIMSLFACGIKTGSKFNPVKPVPIPTTTKEAKSKHNPPAVIVDVERKTVKRGGGGSCHALPVCLVVGAALLYQDLFPQKYDVVTITENGKKTFSGRFTTGGELIEAIEFEGDQVKVYGQFKLGKLGRTMVVQTAVGSFVDGKMVGMKKVPILSQVDIIADYKNKLSEIPHKAQQRGKLIVEAMHWLGTESNDFIKERFSDPKELSQTKGIIVEAICKSRGRVSEDLIQANLPDPAVHAATQATICFLNQKKAAREIVPYIPATVQGLCTGEIDEYNAFLLGTNRFPKVVRTLDKIRQKLVFMAQDDGQAIREKIKQAVEQCADSANTTAVKFAFQLNPKAQELAKAFLDKDVGAWLVRQLNLKNPTSREAAFIALRGEAKTGMHILIRRLSTFSEQNPIFTAEELETVAQLYVDSYSRSDQAHLLYLFSRYAGDGDKTKQAKRLLEKAMPQMSMNRKPVGAMALFLLGEKNQAQTAALGLTDKSAVISTGARSRDRVYGVPSLIFLGFKLANCQNNDIKKIRELVKRSGSFETISCLN